MLPSTRRRTRSTLLLASVLAALLGIAGIAAPRGSVHSIGGGGLMCGCYADADTGTTHIMVGNVLVGRKRWLGEPVAEIATVTLNTAPLRTTGQDIITRAACIDIARQAMLRDATECNLPNAAPLIEVALAPFTSSSAPASPTSTAERPLWWGYPLAFLRKGAPILILLGGAGLIASLILDPSRPRNAAHAEPRCEHCGYNLAGLTGPAAATCPECGNTHNGPSVTSGDSPLASLNPRTPSLRQALISALLIAAFLAFCSWLNRP